MRCRATRICYTSSSPSSPGAAWSWPIRWRWARTRSTCSRSFLAFRSQLLVHSARRTLSQVAARVLVEQAQSLPARKGLKWSLDVDPQDMF